MDRKAKNSGDRIIIGLITSQIHPFACQAEWQGMADAAREMDVNLVIYPGSALNSPHGFEKQENLIYESVLQPALLDGLVMWTGVVDWFISEEELRTFVERFAAMPLVSIEETPLDGTPVISLGNYQGMWDLVQHLLVVHDYQRIAFVSGPEGYRGMNDRYQAYCDCLTAHGREFDAELVVMGDFMIGSGETAVSTLLDERQKDFDAIVAANDTMALGVMQALQARGCIIPLHKAVVGFDDDKTTFPPLTTVYPSFYEMGRISLETCVALVKGQNVPAYIEMPAELLVRRSCGCLPESLDQTVLLTKPSLSDQVPIHQQMATAVLQATPSSPPLDVLEALAQAFVESVFGGVNDLFLAQLDKILLHDVVDGRALTRWHYVISVLRKAGGRHWQSAQQANRVEDLCHQARLLIGDTEHWTDKYQIVVAEHTALKLRTIGDALITAFGLEEMKDLVVDTFPEIGVRQCAVVLYEGDEGVPLRGELLVMYDENGRCPLSPTYLWNFTESMLPPWLLNREQGQTFIVAPLHFREENLGVAVFGIGTQDGMVYETLRLQLSSALKRAFMVREIQDAQNEMEQRVAARTSELEQEAAKHQQTAEALQKSETTTRALLEAIPDAIFLVDEESRFLNFIPSEGMKTAVSLVDYLGLTLADVFPPELAQKFAQAIPRAAHTESLLLQEYPVEIGHDIRYYEARLLGIGRGNVLGIIRDITERKHNETEREHLITELEAKNAELERFTYTVSHDLKSPLVTIKGFLGFLKRDAVDGDIEQLEEDIVRIREAAEQMQSLLDDLLELSRIGHSMKNPEEAPFADIIRKAVDRVHGQIEEKQVEILIQPDLPLVKVDKVRLVEVMQNLLDNAVKYMGDQAQPTISIGTEIVKNETRFYVRDNGQGIEAKYHKKVFGLFDRLDQSEEGTGIGLALAKRIIELHNGRIWVESSGKGHGSTFYFTLSLTDKPNR